MRFTLGLAVFSGMLGVTAFGIFFTPIFYYVVRWFTARKQPSSPAAPPEHVETHPAATERADALHA
jgi:hypothetical protein